MGHCHRLRPILLIGLWMACLIGGIGLTWATTSRFPETRIKSLTGKAWALPQDLPSPRSVVIIAFDPKRQPEINQWLLALDAVKPPVPVLELPVIASQYAAFRPGIEKYMRGVLPGPQDAAKILPVFTNTATFRQRLALDDEKTFYLLVVNRQGQVLGREKGFLTPQKLSALLALLKD